MTQQELSKLLHKVGCPVNEGVSALQNEKIFPRIDYWEYLWEYITGSGKKYVKKITWQVSIYDKKPRGEALRKLEEILQSEGLYPAIQHEYVIEDKIWHSFLSLETVGE